MVYVLGVSTWVALLVYARILVGREFAKGNKKDQSLLVWSAAGTFSVPIVLAVVNPQLTNPVDRALVPCLVPVLMAVMGIAGVIVGLIVQPFVGWLLKGGDPNE